MLTETQVQEQGHTRNVESETRDFWCDPRPETLLKGCLCDNWKPSFLPRLNLTGVHFPSELEHVGHAGEQKMKCRPVRTREITSVRL